MYTNNRDAYRQMFATVWQKHKKQMPLEPVELQVANVISMHPEYHFLLENNNQSQEFALEENPFFHMSLHLAVHDQIKLNRPNGITTIYQTLLQTHHDKHHVEHMIMTHLAQTLWQAQQSNGIPDEAAYLCALKNLLSI